LFNRFMAGRHAGLMLPLSAAPSRQSWGIGELSDLPQICGWLKRAGLDFLQILPIHEMSGDQNSPYSAISAMAIDPIYISLRDVPEFQALGGEDTLTGRQRRQLAAVRASSRVCYNAVRTLKMEALRAAFAQFRDAEWAAGSPRARQLREYLDRERSWVGDYALYRALRERSPSAGWWEWPPALAARVPRAMQRARKELARPCLFYSYLQWLAETQWQAARSAAWPVGVFGDLAFMVGSDSADVWIEQHAFRLDATVGAPPDAFNETGQDWALPVYRWEVFRSEGDAWIRARARRTAALFDGYRIDHLVGFYRTYVIPKDGRAPGFWPAEERDQLAQGERIMSAFLEAGARIIAEDLGTVPDFVRQSLDRLKIPGYKVLRWEREWDAPGQPFRNPQKYPHASVATTGTHDTETLVTWWDGAPPDERARVVAGIPSLATRSLEAVGADGAAAIRDALLETLAASSSDLLILPIQDVFGWRDRINVPGTITDDNWTWRLPWPADGLLDQPEAHSRAETLLRWMQQYDRFRNIPPSAAVAS
jgi:4-alpha-glucanotransferase